MSQPLKISPQDVRTKVTAGTALLVCAYDSDDKFKSNHLEGGISLSEFQSRLAGLSQDQEIIFYCA